ncbi:MAG: type II secretion system protein [Chromatiaceae bacterium]
MTRFRAPPVVQSGFSLLEVLVAFAVLAVTLGVLMQIFSRASVTTVVSAQYSRAASLVSARLDAVGSAIPLEPGSVSGEPDDGIAWELSVVPVELGLAADSDPLGSEPPVVPYLVTVTALWKDSGRVRRLTLSTLRLGERLD